MCASVIKLAIVPLAGWGVGLAVGLTHDQLAICVLQSAMPTAVLVTIFSVKYDADPVFSNAIVSLTTLACMGTIPLFSRIKLQTPVWRCSGSPEGSSYACRIKMPPAPAGGGSLFFLLK